MTRPKFPAGSLLAAMLGEQVPPDIRRAVRRLRSESAPALSVDDDISGLASGLARFDVSRAPAVLDVLPPLFWLEAQWENGSGIRGWIAEKRPSGLAARGFSIGLALGAVPEPEGSVVTLRFGAELQEEDAESRRVRGLVTAAAMPELMAQMGETAPVVLMPAEAADQDVSTLRGFRLAVLMSPESAPS